jgi:predicted transglutaminase-like cysteine proteinase
VNVFQSVAILTVVQGIALAGCSHISAINDEVNQYTYRSDTPEQDKAPPSLMSATQRGDCEDYAYTKCLAVKAAYPQADLKYLYQAKGQNSYGQPHAALYVDGRVLDNTKAQPYRFKAKEWAAYADWNGCEQLNQRDLAMRPIDWLPIH